MPFGRCGGCAGAQFHRRGGQARHFAVGLSYTIRELEARLGVPLLTRTTRSVAPTEAGERLLRTAAPRLEEIEAELAAIRELREKPAGTIRITATEYAADAILLPKLAKLLPEYNIEKNRSLA
jgi:DNA-binding transcriptional LysR family regulator